MAAAPQLIHRRAAVAAQVRRYVASRRGVAAATMVSGETIVMPQNCSVRETIEAAPGRGATVIDLAAHRAARQSDTFDASAAYAAAALRRVETGRAGWAQLAAALIAPFHTSAPDR